MPRPRYYLAITSLFLAIVFGIISLTGAFGVFGVLAQVGLVVCVLLAIYGFTLGRIRTELTSPATPEEDTSEQQ